MLTSCSQKWNLQSFFKFLALIRKTNKTYNCIHLQILHIEKRVYRSCKK